MKYYLSAFLALLFVSSGLAQNVNVTNPKVAGANGIGPVNVILRSTTGAYVDATGGGGGGGGGAVTVADGEDATQGAIADASVTAGATGSISAKLRRISADIDSVKTNTTGLATAANQTTSATTLSTIATNTTSIATAANQTTGNTSLATIATNTTGAATAANQTTGNSSLSTIATNTTGAATAANQATANSSLSTIATNTTTNVGTGTVVSSSAYEASHVLKASAGTLVSVFGYNSKASAQFIQLFNSTTVPADTAVPIAVFTVAATSNFSLDVPITGLPFATGIAVSNSSTGPTKTIGSADCYFTAVVK